MKAVLTVDYVLFIKPEQAEFLLTPTSPEQKSIVQFKKTGGTTMKRSLVGVRMVILASLVMCGAVWSLQAQNAPAPGKASERFEVKSVKAVRPKLLSLISALQKKDAAAAKAAFEAYDGAWNGIEVYINFRYIDMYNLIEHTHGDKVDKGLEEPNPDFAALLSEAQAMLMKFDETVAMIEKAPPISPLFDDIARLRIVRADIRPLNPALKAGDIAKARKALAAFRKDWPSVEPLIKGRSQDADAAVNKGLVDLDTALKQSKPDVEQTTSLSNATVLQYNQVLGQINREARAAK
jgi:hypothetical protein